MVVARAQKGARAGAETSRGCSVQGARGRQAKGQSWGALQS